MERTIQTDNTNYEGCMLVNNCNYKTATCYVCEPDDGCYPYRYIKKIIEKENTKMEDKESPQESCEDCISRADAIEFFKDNVKSVKKTGLNVLGVQL